MLVRLPRRYWGTGMSMDFVERIIANAADLATIAKGALERLEVCSNDPICADHKPDDHNDFRALHGAACHGCLLVAENSCKRCNRLLDRALLVGTIYGRLRWLSEDPDFAIDL
jgi:hypothetical protein